MNDRKPPSYPEPKTVALFGKQIFLNKRIGKLIFANDDVYERISNYCSVEENGSFRVISTLKFFEDCSNPDQKIIDVMASAHPGPELFLLAVDSETSSSEDVLTQINKLEEIFGNSIRKHLILIFNQHKLYESLLYLKDNNIQLEMLNDNLASDCQKWGATRSSFLYNYKDYSEQVVRRRKNELQMRSSLEAETETRPRSRIRFNERYNKYGRTTHFTASSDATDIDKASQGDQINPQENVSPPGRAADPRRGMKNGMPVSDFNIILMGRSGCGKSASANTILQTAEAYKNKLFESKASSQGVTTSIQVRHVSKMFGRPVNVIDTPDFFRDNLTNVEEVVELCKQYITENCVILLVYQLGRITDHDYGFIEKLESTFGTTNIREKATVLFTHGDDMNRDLKEHINQNPILSDIVQKCGNRYHLFNNKTKDPKQVKELTKIIPRFETASKTNKASCSLSIM
ncbi:GTPase IMAP family member 8-like [Corythoichthys intestinalis]|uniref:GTPase IMAP family member 8-like n=1 Tax=Corythoichthys intestinalis TaxID=161448 RepID=UPI0025A555B9|nr:GTPase IMAP family member 8-like [Corythoichthys intestinalis]